MAIVSVKTQQVTFYDADGWFLRAPVSTGAKGRETPAGVFAILEKDLDHHSSLYDDASMPHMQRLTWNGIAMHGGPLPGYAASHGCVRLPFGFAESVFGQTRVGMRVIVSPDDADPVAFSHAALLQPNAAALAAAPARAETLDRQAAEAAKASDEANQAVLKIAREAASLKTAQSKLEKLKAAAEAELASAEKALAAAQADAAKAMELAEDRQALAVAKAADAARRLGSARADAKPKLEAAEGAMETAKAAAQTVSEGAPLEASLRKLEKLKTAADADLARAETALAAAKTDQAKARAEDQKLKATAKATAVGMLVDSASADAKPKLELAERAKETAKAAAQIVSEAAPLNAALGKLEKLKAAADAEFARAETALAAAKADQTAARAEDRKALAAAKAADAGTQLVRASAEATSKFEAAGKAKDAVKTAASRKSETAKAATEAKLALEPVSIYISRATQKLYVRRNTHKPWVDGGEVYDTTIEAPVTIRDPDQPIGTHVFTAMARQDKGLRWSVVTIDSGDDAKDALDRIIIPKDVLDRIAPSALPRSSIIVSDEPLSKETNFRTEFVAVLSKQPQGGFKTRQPTPVVSVAANGGSSLFDLFGQSQPTGSARKRGGKSKVQLDWIW